MSDLRDWSTVGVTDHGCSLITRDVERTKLYAAPAILHRPPRGGMSVTISWQTSIEHFVIKPDEDMTFRDGDQILVLVSTVTSSRLGCHNGHALVEAVQTSPEAWSRNLI